MIILGTNSIKDTGYDVANSARFDSGSSDYLNRTPSSTSNRKTFTFSFWVKRTKLGTNDTIYNVRPDSNGANRISFHSTTNTFRIALEPINKYIFTNRVFRDVSAWYHIVAAFDTTQGTASNRVKIYINGVQETSFSTETYPDQDADLDINTQNVINLGRDLETSSDFIDMYLAEFVFIDGQQLDPTSFGEFDEDSGIWKPIDVSGLTFGTNGFYLDFEDSSALGNDAAGSNNFTVNNLTSIDQSIDTCTNNFATMNPLDNYFAGSTFSEGNLHVLTNASNYSFNTSTFAVSSGKWYWEVKIGSNTTVNNMFGIADRVATSSTQTVGTFTTSYSLLGTGRLYQNNSTTDSWGSSYTTDDIMSVALDLDNNRLFFAKNGTFQNSGDPTSSTGAISITAAASTSNGVYFPAFGDFSGSDDTDWLVNFGSPPYSESGGNSDGNGYGNFAHAVPSKLLFS